MSKFKKQVERDTAVTFLNVDEFADVKRVVYDKTDVQIPVVLDNDVTQGRRIGKDGTQTSNDHAVGISLGEVRAYINERDIGVVPRRGKRIQIGARDYKINKAALEMGVIVLDLEVFVE